MNDEPITRVAAGLAGRLRSLVMAIDRLDRLESGSGLWLDGFNEAELAEAVTFLTLRALNTVSDPGNFALLKVLSVGESQTMSYLVETMGYGRLQLSERLNDLVQVGLAQRLIDTDQAQVTGAGAAIVHIVEQMIAETSAQYLAKTDV